MVDSTNLPEVDINAIATDLNNKMDRDCLNASDTGNIQMAKASMPSNKYIDLTLNASGSTYTAPADGWFYINKVSTSTDQYLTLDTGVVTRVWSSGGSQGLVAFVPVLKGRNLTVTYSAAGNTQFFRFIYAVGSESEAN